MDEDYRAILWQNQVWPSREILALEAEPKASRMQAPPHPKLRLGVPAPDPGHALTASLGGQGIDHGNSFAEGSWEFQGLRYSV